MNNFRKAVFDAVKNRIPNGIEYRCLVYSYSLYKNNRNIGFYKKQFLHNIKSYFIVSQKRSPMKYEISEKSIPKVLYHISKEENISSINKFGLFSLYNPAVFLSDSVDFFENNNKNQSCNCVILKIDSRQMEKDGYSFFNDIEPKRSAIWCTESVPPEYITVYKKSNC